MVMLVRCLRGHGLVIGVHVGRTGGAPLGCGEALEVAVMLFCCFVMGGVGFRFVAVDGRGAHVGVDGREIWAGDAGSEAAHLCDRGATVLLEGSCVSFCGQ